MATLAQEQNELRSILEAPGATGVGGRPLGGAYTGTPGADITQASPATTQLLEEAIKTRTGNVEGAVASSQAFTGQTGTTTPSTTSTGTTEARPILSSGTDTSMYSQANPYAPGSASANAWEAQNKQQATEPSVSDFEVPKPRSLEEIRQEQLEQAQSVIDATEQLYQTEISRLEQQGREQLARTSSISVGAGLAGSPFQQTAEAKTQEATEDVLASRRAERQAQVAQIMAAAQNQATEQYDREITRFQQEREFAVSERDKEIVRQTAAKSALATTITNMAAGSISLDDMSEDEYRAMLAEGRMSDFEARGIWAKNTPGANAQYTIQNGQLVGYYFDPVSGKPVVTTTALPEELKGALNPDIDTFLDGMGQVFWYDRNNPYNEDGTPKTFKVGAPNLQKVEEVTGTDQDITRQKLQFETTETAITTAEKFADAAGRSPWREAIAHGLFGETDFTNLQAATNTIKTNLLTLSSDPNVKKFFGPQMSNADVKLMMAGGTTLDPELQGPKEFKEELVRVKDIIVRAKAAVEQGTSSSLPPLTQGYTSLDALVKDNPDYLPFIEQIDGQYPNATDEEILQIIKDEQSDFNSDPSTSLKGIIGVNLGTREVKVDSSISNKLAMADADYFKATGNHIPVNQSYRTREQQAELYRKSQAGLIGRTAPPGKSFHETGKAIDVGDAWKDVAPYLSKYGFRNDLPDDRGHFSIGEFS